MDLNHGWLFPHRGRTTRPPSTQGEKGHGPDLKGALLQPLVPEHEAVMVPPQGLDPIPPLVHEQEQAAFGRFVAENATDEAKEPRESLPHVGGVGV